MSEKKRDWIKWGVIINFIMLIVVLFSLFNISIPLPSFAKVEHTICTLEEPISPEILPALKISPLYYIELIVKPPYDLNYGDTLKFSIKTSDKGKKPIEEPEFRIFLVDSIGNVRGVYPSQAVNLIKSNSTNLLLINDDIEKESKSTINFNFKMPSEDQKVMGDWKIFVYLFDKSNGALVAYNVCEFTVVSETEPTEILIRVGLTLMLFALFAIIPISIIFLSNRIIRKYIKKRHNNEKDKDDKEKK